MKIPITVYEEVKRGEIMRLTGLARTKSRYILTYFDFVWFDNNGINTPYRVTIVNKG